MLSVFAKDYNGRSIRVRQDEYVCLTDMAAIGGKLFADWYRLKTTQSYLSTLSTVTGIPITDNHAGSSLVSVIQGIGIEQGTWGHRKVAIRFAQWCSDEFAIQVDFWIDELLNTGSVSIASKPDTKDLDLDKERKSGIVARREYTDLALTFKPTPKDYAIATNQTYLGLFGETAAQLKESRGLKKRQSARDGMNEIELAAVRLTELSVARNQSIASIRQLNQASFAQAQAISLALKAI